MGKQAQTFLIFATNYLQRKIINHKYAHNLIFCQLYNNKNNQIFGIIFQNKILLHKMVNVSRNLEKYSIYILSRWQNNFNCVPLKCF